MGGRMLGQRGHTARSGLSGLPQFRVRAGAVRMGTISGQQHSSEAAERSVPAAGSRRTTTARVTGGLFIASTVAFMIAATVLSMTFDWPDILRQPADVVLPEFAAGGA